MSEDAEAERRARTVWPRGYECRNAECPSYGIRTWLQRPDPGTNYMLLLLPVVECAACGCTPERVRS